MLPRRPRDHRGVSEVIGTILILLITVIIFSSIVLWVFTLPAPRAAGNVGIDGSLEGRYVAGSWAGAYVNLTHLGGDDLLDGNTRVYLTIDEQIHAFRTQGNHFDGVSVKPYGVKGPDVQWNIGETWSYENETIPLNAEVSVLVVDVVRGTVVWDQALLGVPGDHAPIFLDKWVDSLPSTPTRDRVEAADRFTLYARVIDPDLDLNNRSVWAYLTFGLTATPLAPLGYIQLLDDGSAAVGDKLAGDGIFSRALTHKAQKGWDGGIILLNATDVEGHTSATRLFLKVGRGSGAFGNPFGGTWNSTLGGIGQGDSGPQGDQGWNIYDEDGLPTADNPAGTPTRTFQPGATVYVIARSTVIQNVENINSFVLRDATGVKLYPPSKEFDSRDPAKNDPAFTQTVTSPFFEYEYSFAAPVTVGTYSVELTLKDNAGHAVLFGMDNIWISTSGTPPAYPKIVTYRDPNGDGDLSDLVETTRFNTTELLYARVFFQDLDTDYASCSPWFAMVTCPVGVNANAGDVEIVDYYGGTPVKRRPGNSPVSNVSTFPYDQPGENSYVFYIDLLRRVQDPWIPGQNFYALRIRHIADFGFAMTTAESYQMLSAPVEIIAPLSTIDIVSSTEQKTGDDDRGVYWYDSGHGWQEHTIDLLPEDTKKPL
ncbi:MAG: type IV pilin, partial [Thermoplasmata archaeon]